MNKKFIIFNILYTFIFLSIFTVHVQAKDSSVINWGLHYEESGKIPVGNATAEYLEAHNACFYGTSKGDEKTLFLTFDAGYENGFTEKILDTLKENNVPATFFLVGTYLETNPELTKRIIDEGHIIGNHTVSHGNMTKKSPKDFSAELKKFDEILESMGVSNMPKYYRPPEGKFNESNLITAKELGYKTVLWSASYADWDNKKQPSREHAFEKLMPRLHPGAILLLHSTSATSTDILPDFITECRKLGYEFKSLNEL